jgi:hypothetical protein
MVDAAAKLRVFCLQQMGPPCRYDADGIAMPIIAIPYFLKVRN